MKIMGKDVRRKAAVSVVLTKEFSLWALETWTSVWYNLPL